MKNYLIISEYHHFIDNEINKIIVDSNNVFYYDLENVNMNSIINEINYISLFDQKKYVVCKNYIQAKKLDNKADTDNDESLSDKELLDYILNPNPNVSLIIVTSQKLDERKKITKAFNEHCQIINLLGINDNQLVEIIIDFMKKYNCQCNRICAELIKEKCLNNYDLIINESEKLVIACSGNKVINENDIDAIVSDYFGDDFFRIKDLIIKKNAIKAEKLLKHYLLAKKSVVPFISLLANEYRLIYLVKNTRLTDDEIAKALLKLNSSSYPVKLARNNVHYYNNNELLNNITKLADLDYQIKSGNIDEEIGFDLFLFDVFKGEL